MVSLAENARVPIDNPATHLELTMIHEAMVLEYSARHLALIEWAPRSSSSTTRASASRCSCPSASRRAATTGSRSRSPLPVLLGQARAGGFGLAFIEMTSAKMRIFRAPEFLGTAFLLAVLAMLVNRLLGA
jgi:formate hydrogenlyase subunit 4